MLNTLDLILRFGEMWIDVVNSILEIL